MALRRNPVTGIWEDDGTGVANPVVAPAIQGPPLPDPAPPGPVTVDTPLERMLAQADTVSPGDLVVNAQRAAYTPTGALAPAAPAALPDAPIVGGSPSPGVPALDTGGSLDAGVPLLAAPGKTKASGVGGGGAVPSALQAELVKAQGEQEKGAQAETAANVARAGAESQVAGDVAAQRRQELLDRAAQKEAATSENSKLQAQADAEDQKYKAMGYTDFWSHATIMGRPNTATGARVLGLLSVALGTAGASLTHGPNYALEQMNTLIAQDYQRQKDAILKQKDVVNEARGRAAEAKAEKLLALENWRKNAYELTEAEGKAKLAAMGPQAAEAKGASTLGAIHEKAVESRQALSLGQAQLAEIKASTALKYAEAAKDKAAAGAKEAKPPSMRDTEEFARLETDAQKIEQAKRIIQQNPAAWEEVRKNSLDWKQKETAAKNSSTYAGLRGIAQGMGAASVEERQNLKSDAAKALAPLIFDAQVSIAKGYGPIVTKAHKELAEKAAQFANMTPKDMVRSLQTIQDGLTSQRDLILKNRPMNEPPSGARTPVTPGNPGGPGGKVTPGDRLLLQQLIKNNKNDPRAPQWQALLEQ